MPWIQSHDFFNINSTPTRSGHHPVDLNFSITDSSNSSSSFTTANISGTDFPVFTTDSQSTWPPQPASSLPAQPEHQPQPNNQDFVLFDSPQPPAQPPPNRSTSNSLSSQRRHSSHNNRVPYQSPAIQNQRVAQIIQATGHQQQQQNQQQQSPSPVNARPSGHNFYASSAPPSIVSSSNNDSNARPAKPPVPLFHQSAGLTTTAAKMMNAADVDLDEFAAFENGGYTAFSSPAVATNLDFSGSASSSMTNFVTVSPHDLLVADSFISAPNSSALTALTSPSINESPDFDSYDVSPNFGSADFEYPPTDNWYPLFPPTDAGIPEQPKKVETSPTERSDDLDAAELRSISSARRKSGTSPTTTTGAPRHSSVSGVNARKRDKPLPPIIIDDPSDTTAMKRARNTLAARKSRERKAQRLDELEDKIAKLEAERDHWKSIALGQSGTEN
ncbi:Basic region leucine zipper [Geosmithia morbida]|uniref:Cross-pathway control protein 1 n=1 Tax=Geosmithia morbida TaxID=1094350 RepID=A0A9P4YUY1_9HYPO|nr:Basic region leucine zipper [Geosmithia morbida]KAF4122158.1 Basic region leucine zipper [Geosmithia morbida]